MQVGSHVKAIRKLVAASFIADSKECEHIPTVTEGRIVSFSTDGQAYVDFDPQETFRTGLWVQCVFEFDGKIKKWTELEEN